MAGSKRKDELNTLKRAHFVHSKEGPNLQGIWKARRAELTLNEVLPHLQNKSDNCLIDSTPLGGLLSFEESLRDKLFPRAFTMGVVSLKDGCLIKFAVEHPFCDANGLYRIANAYCTILGGGAIEQMGPRMPIELREDDTQKSSLQADVDSEYTGTRYGDYFTHGWMHLCGALYRCQKNKRKGSRRVQRAALIPNYVIDKLAKEAEGEGIRVTRHDLLMALVYVATMPDIFQLPLKETGEPPHFSFTLNIAKLLQKDSQFHNPWILIPAPDIEATDLSRRSPIIATAKQLRAIISDTRQLGPVRHILEQHSNVQSAPMAIKGYGSCEQNTILSSWTNLPLYDLEFASSDGSRVSPEYVQVSLGFCRGLRSLGASLDDAVLTCTSDEGFWVQGILDEVSWERIVDFSLYQQ